MKRDTIKQTTQNSVLEWLGISEYIYGRANENTNAAKVRLNLLSIGQSW